MTMREEFYMQMLQTAASAGLPIISKETAAKICFIVYAYGGAREEFVYSPKLRAEVKYIQKMYHIYGAGTPDAELVEMIQELNKNNSLDTIPQWADEFCIKRYGFKLKTTTVFD